MLVNTSIVERRLILKIMLPPKTQAKETSRTKEKTAHLNRTSTVSFVEKRIKSFEDVKIKANCSAIDLSSNRIQNFTGLSSLSLLSQLNLDGNPIKSFEGCPNLPHLKWISMKNSPLSRNLYFKLMCIVAFGNQLTTINNEKVQDCYRKQADALRELLLPELRAGRLITNLKPLRMIDTKESCRVAPDAELVSASANVTYTTPHMMTKLMTMQSVPVAADPSVALLCDVLVAKRDLSGIPESVAQQMREKLAQMRSGNEATEIMEIEEEEQAKLVEDEVVFQEEEGECEKLDDHEEEPNEE